MGSQPPDCTLYSVVEIGNTPKLYRYGTSCSSQILINTDMDKDSCM